MNEKIEKAIEFLEDVKKKNTGNFRFVLLGCEKQKTGNSVFDVFSDATIGDLITFYVADLKTMVSAKQVEPTALIKYILKEIADEVVSFTPEKETN